MGLDNIKEVMDFYSILMNLTKPLILFCFYPFHILFPEKVPPYLQPEKRTPFGQSIPL